MLSTIFILVSILLISLSSLLIALHFGKPYLYAVLAALNVVAIFTITMFVDLWGWPILLGEIFYASFFFATDLFTEHYGTKEARKLIWVIVCTQIFALLIAPVIMMIDPSHPVSLALGTLFEGIVLYITIPTIVLAVFVEQRFDIWLYHKIHQWTGEGHLWLRNTASTAATQLLDVFLIYPLVFYPVVGADVWMFMISAYVLKLSMAVLDTPLIYLSKMFIKKDTKF